MMIGSMPAATETRQIDRLRQQAEELEGVFLHSLVKQMFSGIKTDGIFGGGFGEETWRSMQAEQLAQSMAEAGGIGLADHVLGDLIAAQQSAVPATPLTAANAYNGVTR
jgi:peptidoglycan hydrolase FlgJ